MCFVYSIFILLFLLSWLSLHSSASHSFCIPFWFYRSCSLLSLSLHLVFVHVCAQDYNKVYVACSSQLLPMFYIDNTLQYITLHYQCDADASPSFRSLSSPSLGLPQWLTQWARICLQCRSYRRGGFIPWVRKIPLRRTGQPTPVFLPGESHGQGSPTSYSPYGHEELDMTEHAHTFSLFMI